MYAVGCGFIPRTVKLATHGSGLSIDIPHSGSKIAISGAARNPALRLSCTGLAGSESRRADMSESLSISRCLRSGGALRRALYLAKYLGLLACVSVAWAQSEQT